MNARSRPRPGGDICRFGPFEADLRKFELRKFGIRVRLESKPWYLLLALLERPGELVTRSALARTVWGDGVYVDFENGLNVAVKKVRDALGDSADAPRYIETVTGEGYRFIAPVERVKPLVSAQSVPEEVPGAKATEIANQPLAAVRAEVPRRRYLWLLAAALAVLAVGAWSLWRGFRHSAPLVNGSGWVLIANFENRTGEHLFDGTLEYALERELSNSRFLKVVPRERIEDALRLMKKPLDSRIDAGLSREICLRDGEIQVLITGRVEKLGTTYVLSAEIVNPVSGVRVASLSEEETAERQFAAVVRRLSNRVREAAGESTHQVRQSNDHLEKVTTPSLRAAQLYNQADHVVGRGPGGNREAVELLEQALKEDVDFASAHLLLAHAYADLDQNDRALPHFQRAFELADSTTDREKFFILGSYYDRAANQLEKAAAAYEALLRLYPDHYWGNNNLTDIYVRTGRMHETTERWVHLADLRPKDLHCNRMAAQSLANEAAWNQAERYIARALELLQEEGESDRPNEADELRLLVMRQDEFKGDIAKQHADLLVADRENKTMPAFLLGRLFLGFGELREARAHLAGNNVAGAVIAYSCGDFSKANELLDVRQQMDPLRLDLAASVLIRLGRLNDAEILHQRMLPLFSDSELPRIQVVEGQLALARGQIAKGITLLEQALPQFEGATSSILGYEALANAYRKKGKLNDAVRVLERQSQVDNKAPLSQAFRMRVRLQLADVYRELGRISDAERVESDLRTKLQFADPDHPVLLALSKRARQ